MLVAIALAVAAALCAFLAAKSSSDELEGAYRESARDLLAASSSSFEARVMGDALRKPDVLDRELGILVDTHPALETAGIYRPGESTPEVSRGIEIGGQTELELVTAAVDSGESQAARTQDDGRNAELLATPLQEDGRIEAVLTTGYDLDPAEAALADRNRRVAIVLALLLGSFTVFAVVVLSRGIFRPLDRLRLATRAVGSGDFSTRLGWNRRDELGDLARDFDSMAAALSQNNTRLEELAHRDPLTGLANHRRFQELLGAEVERARATNHPLAVVLVDIDDFQRLNESYGHPFGDEILRSAATHLGGAMRGLGTVARVGGDVFAILLPDAEGGRAFALAEAARAAVETAGTPRGGIRCSAGTACFPRDARTAPALLQLAEGALRWAKDSGRGRTRSYDAEHVFVVTDEQREDFARLISRPDAIHPVFQPIVSLTSGEPVGFEALARFGGSPGLAPSWWFSQAHRFGLGAELEAQAVERALAAPGVPRDAFISVNLSPSALASREVQERLPNDLRGVVIEITEEERVLDAHALQRHLEPLRSRGARIAVDDTGEGYAGLQQVMSMRADIIKLDRALVADVHSDPAKIALIGSLVHFARSTGASICAEGIETLDELRVLIHLGVATGQGWALARPGAPWPRVNAEAASLCRELRRESDKIVPLGSRRSA